MRESSFQTPPDYFKGLVKNFRFDSLTALFLVFFALPYSLVSTYGSGFPVQAGLITVLVGSLVLGFLSGSPLSVRAPALSTAPLLFVAIHSLGSGYLETGFRVVLAIILLCGILQILWGLLGLGNWLNTIPESITYGLVSSLGILLVIQQVYPLVGLEIPNGVFTHQVMEFPLELIYQMKIEFVLIGLLCLAALAIASYFQSRNAPLILTALLVVCLGAGMAWFMDVRNRFGHDIFLYPAEGIDHMFAWADLNRMRDWKAFELILSMALILSLESLLNTRSTEATDFYRRRSRSNWELISLGIGNFLCGLLGGLPMFTSQTQSAINVNGGAKTRWSGIFLGLFFGLGYMILVPWIIWVPQGCVAAILLHWIYRTYSPQLFSNILNIGWDQMVIFLGTLTSALFLGVLGGFGVGLLLSWLIYWILGTPLKHLFRIQLKVVNYPNQRSKVMVRSEALASNFLNLRKQLKTIPPQNHVYLDFTKCKLVEHSFLELIYHYPHVSPDNEMGLELQGLDEHISLSRHPLATRRDKSGFRLAKYTQESTQYNERQLDVLAVASINNAKLKPHLNYDGGRLKGFRFAMGYDIKYRENKFFKKYRTNPEAPASQIEFSDILISRGTRLQEETHTLSVVLISRLSLAIPVFNLGKENLLAKVWQTLGYEDIDFDEYPKFSEYYLLQGLNSLEIRGFFHAELIEFLEENQDFNVESYNNRILIHKNLTLMNRNEMEDAIDFAEKLLDIILVEHNPDSLSQDLESIAN